jgi:Holliday junction resolvase RusA-like endonuclease
VSTFTFIIPGKPVAKKRPRFARRGKFVTTYNDQETEEGRFLWEIKSQWKRPQIEGPVSLKANFFFDYPKSMPNKVVASDPSYTKKPDLDNLCKFFKDVFNGTVWKDDSLVIAMSATKSYGKARSEITIWWDAKEEGK